MNSIKITSLAKYFVGAERNDELENGLSLATPLYLHVPPARPLRTPKSIPFCHDGVGVHLTGFPPPFLSFDPGELGFVEPPNCFLGAFAPTTVE